MRHPSGVGTPTRNAAGTSRTNWHGWHRTLPFVDRGSRRPLGTLKPPGQLYSALTALLLRPTCRRYDPSEAQHHGRLSSSALCCSDGTNLRIARHLRQRQLWRSEKSEEACRWTGELLYHDLEDLGRLTSVGKQLLCRKELNYGRMNDQDLLQLNTEVCVYSFDRRTGHSRPA